MADLNQVFAAFEKMGRQARILIEAQRAAYGGFQLGAGQVRVNIGTDLSQADGGYSVSDQKASAAYHPYPPPAAPLEVQTPQPAQERKRFLRISKGKDAAFFVKIPAASPSNILGRVAQGQIGEWHVEEVIDEVPVRLGSFDHYDEAVAYVARVLATVGDGSTEDEHEYASVGEVPC